MAQKIEQKEAGRLGSHRKGRNARAARSLKRGTHKKERREGKRLLDDAPNKRQFEGYEL